MWCIFDKFIFLTLHFFYFYSIFIFVINYTATFKKDRVNSWSSVCPHGIIFFGSCLFQLFQNLVRTHPACQQLLQYTLGFCFFCFFSGLSIRLRLLRFQGCHFFFGLLQSSLLLFQCVLLLFNRFLDRYDLGG